jgi:purine-binding chemotaxis protein CheW
MHGLSFYVDGELYAADVTSVQKVVRNMTVTPVPGASKAIIGIANLKGKVVTVFNLYTLLGQKERRNKTARAANVGDSVSAVIFKSFSKDGENQIGLSIDKPSELIMVDDALIEPPALTTGREESYCISGIAEVGGTLYRIIALDKIINKHSYGGLENA